MTWSLFFILEQHDNFARFGLWANKPLVKWISDFMVINVVTLSFRNFDAVIVSFRVLDLAKFVPPMRSNIYKYFFRECAIILHLLLFKSVVDDIEVQGGICTFQAKYIIFLNFIDCKDTLHQTVKIKIVLFSWRFHWTSINYVQLWEKSVIIYNSASGPGKYLE